MQTLSRELSLAWNPSKAEQVPITIVLIGAGGQATRKEAKYVDTKARGVTPLYP